MVKKREIPEVDRFHCVSCQEVWYVLNRSSPRGFAFDLFADSSHTQKCPKCNKNSIQKIDIQHALCSWVESEIHCKAVFGRNGYYKDSRWPAIPIPWERYFEKELISFDGVFKSIVSHLANASLDNNFRLIPDIYRTKQGLLAFHHEVCYPLFQEVAKKTIPRRNTLKIVSFLKSEGALKKDGIAFSFCPTCGSKNNLAFRMEEKACEGCYSYENPPCDGCPTYDIEIGECGAGFRIGTQDCCEISPNGDCPGPTWLEYYCPGCDETDRDAIVEFRSPEKKEIDELLNPEDCDCFGIRYRLVSDVLRKLNRGFTFQDMILDEIESEGWNAFSGRRRGRSGVHQDADMLCKKGSKHVLVECKRLSSSKGITLDVVLNLFARMHDLGADRGLIVSTTTKVSPEARSFGRFYGIKILHVEDFLKGSLDEIIG